MCTGVPTYISLESQHLFSFLEPRGGAPDLLCHLIDLSLLLLEDGVDKVQLILHLHVQNAHLLEIGRLQEELILVFVAPLEKLFGLLLVENGARIVDLHRNVRAISSTRPFF